MQPIAAHRVLLVASLALSAACGSGGGKHPLPPRAPMPGGPGWAGRWVTSFGTIDLQPVAIADVQFGSNYQLRRDGATVSGTLACKTLDNYLYCSWDDVPIGSSATGVAVWVMNPDGQSFVGNWGSRTGTVHWEGRRTQ